MLLVTGGTQKAKGNEKQTFTVSAPWSLLALEVQIHLLAKGAREPRYTSDSSQTKNTKALGV